MSHRYFVLAAMYFGGLVFAPSAQADNRTDVERLKIEAEYDACTADKTQNAEYCATETWSIEVNSGGWRATSTGTDGQPPVLETQVTCADGKYKSVTNGQAWQGKCELVGDAARPCFHISGGGAKEAFSKVDSTQCFDLAQDPCSVTVEGVMIGQVEPVKGHYVIALKQQKSCRVVE